MLFDVPSWIPWIVELRRPYIINLKNKISAHLLTYNLKLISRHSLLIERTKRAQWLFARVTSLIEPIDL